MGRYLARRILQTIPILFLISVIQFALINIAPGGPLKAYLENPDISRDDVFRLEEQLGLHDPLPVQYLKWMGNLLRGDLGRSYFTHRPVTESVLERLPVTLELNFASLLISYLIGIPMGVYAALHRGGRADHIIRVFTSVLNAIPHWWLGLLIIILIANIKLSYGFLILPTGGYRSLDIDGFNLLDNLWHLFLPAMMLGTGGWVGFARYIRTETLEVLGQDYVRTAHAKGLSARVVTIRHVFRNSLIPLVTLSASVLTIFIGGSVLIENVFSWPGMGRLTFDAAVKRDYPIEMGVLTISTLLIVAGRLIADIAYGWVDPRIRYD